MAPSMRPRRPRSGCSQAARPIRDSFAQGDMTAGAPMGTPYPCASESRLKSLPWVRSARGKPPQIPANAGEVATDADIVRTLRRKAANGDVNAARELREWRSAEQDGLQGDAWMALLDARERRIVRAIIARARARADAPDATGSSTLRRHAERGYPFLPNLPTTCPPLTSPHRQPARPVTPSVVGRGSEAD